MKHRTLSRLLSGLMAVAIIITPLSAAEWQPEEPVDAKQVLDNARNDRLARRYKEALDKHLWFHDNALQYQPALQGVRLSFALNDWLELAKVYPPALAAMQDQARQAEGRILANDITRFEDFHDVVAINRTLNQVQKSIELFKQIDATQPRDARQMLVYIRQSLLEANEYQLVRKHIDPRESLRMSFVQYDSLNGISSNSQYAQRYADLAEQSLNQDVGNLVALLSVLGEHELAAEIRNSALKKSSNDSLEATLKAATDGVFPPPVF